MIKYISYTGKYPILCHGVLTVEINGKEVKFGHNSEQYDYKTNSYLDEDKNNPNYEGFWISGGKICKNKKWEMWAEEGPWKLIFTDDNYPNEIKNLLPKLIELFNENVPHGCCGGCI